MINEKERVINEKLEEQKWLISEIAAGDSAMKFVGVLLVLFGFVVQNLPENWAPPPIL